MRRSMLTFLTVSGIAAALLPVAAEATSLNQRLRVTSSLDGKRVLPHRISWLAFPHLQTTSALKVDFLIDGKVRWSESKAPYSYSDDGGFLVTSFLAPGMHRFTVRVKTLDGRTVADSVRARVRSAPLPAAQLAGRWRRDVPQPVPADPGASGSAAVPAGAWTLEFDQRWLETTAPGAFDPVESAKTGFGYILDSDYVPGNGRFHVAGSVTIAPITDANPRGGWWCDPEGPEADYSWAVSGSTLTLTPIGGSDPCHQRGGILAGQWTRAG